MNQLSYRPGAWQIVVESGGVIAVPEDVDSARLESLHRMLRDGTPQLTDVIDVLAGGSISALGSFAVALTSRSSVRFAVRGGVQVLIAGAAGDEVVSGAEVSTWTERFIADAPGFEISVDGAPDGPWYPIGSGVVLASAVRQGVDAESSVQVGSAQAVPARDAGSPPAHASATGGDPEPGLDDEPLIAHTLVPADLTFVPEPEPEPEPEPAPESGSSPGVPSAGAGVAAAGTGAAPAPDTTALGDHDGETISVAELRRLRSQPGLTTPPPAAGPDDATAVLPVIDAPAASGGHGVARLSTGQVVELDRTVIIGRRPRSTRVSADSMPHLVAVDSPQQDISRSHLEIRPEGDSVVVIDLRTTNGSTLLRPGADPVRLHPGEQTLVLSGDVVDLGDGVTVAFEGLA